MKAGRELDALVAEKVMELEVVWHGGNLFYKEQGKFHQYELLVPEYSSFMGEAWLVVEKLYEHGAEVQIHVDLCGTNVAVIDGEAVLADVTEKEAPLAICLAALKVKGVEL